MSTKAEVLKLLESNKGIYFSGEDIAKQCHVSRAAIWKTIKNLKKEGYNIDAISNKGYCMIEGDDILSLEGIQQYIQGEYDIHYESVVTSTNTLTVQKAIQGEKEGYILVSGMQSAGRGRTGHTFYSPSSSGVYLSILLRPTTKNALEATNITSMAAVAACDAIEKVSNQEAKIKWINDVFINHKKVLGILTEASISMETKCMDYVVMGIGFNAYTPEDGFPEDIKDIAGPIFKEKVDNGRNQLVAYFIDAFMNYYTHWDKKEYYQKYKEKSFVLGKEILVSSPNGLKTVYAKDIDENFELIIIDEGVEKTVSSGEIHIKV